MPEDCEQSAGVTERTNLHDRPWRGWRLDRKSLSLRTARISELRAFCRVPESENKEQIKKRAQGKNKMQSYSSDREEGGGLIEKTYLLYITFRKNHQYIFYIKIKLLCLPDNSCNKKTPVHYANITHGRSQCEKYGII